MRARRNDGGRPARPPSNLLVERSETPDHPWLEGVPAAETLASDEEARQLLAAVNGPSRMSKPYPVSPEVPADRVEALRQGLARVAEDPQFLADTDQAGFEIHYKSGEEVEEIVNSVLGMPEPLLERLKEILQ